MVFHRRYFNEDQEGGIRFFGFSRQPYHVFGYMELFGVKHEERNDKHRASTPASKPAFPITFKGIQN